MWFIDLFTIIEVSLDGIDNLLTQTDKDSSLNKGCGHMIVNFNIHATNVFPTKPKEDINMMAQLYRFILVCTLIHYESHETHSEHSDGSIEPCVLSNS